MNKPLLAHLIDNSIRQYMRRIYRSINDVVEYVIALGVYWVGGGPLHLPFCNWERWEL